MASTIADNVNKFTLKPISFKTKNVANALKNLNVSKALVVLEDGNVNAELSAKNIAGGKTAKTKKAIVTLTEDSKDIEIFEGL